VDPRPALIRAHRQEWTGLDQLKQLAIQAATDPAFKPQDLVREQSCSWDAEARIGFAKEVGALYRVLVDATAARQEAERRAHGIDPKALQAVHSGEQPISEHVRQALKQMEAATAVIVRRTQALPREEVDAIYAAHGLANPS